MKKALFLMLVAALLVFAGTVHADTFTLHNYTVNANTGDPGLIINTSPLLANDSTWNLSVGDSVTFDLFRIWTPENSVGDDDKNPKDISVAFNWTAPPGTIPNDAGGTTKGVTSWSGFTQYGQVAWNNPTTFTFGNGGQFHITLSDAAFNGGIFWGLNEGWCDGADVKATLTYDAASVPEPATLLLLGLGLIGTLGVRKLRK